MNLEEFNAFRQMVEKNGVFFYYNGYLSHNILASIGDALKSKLETLEDRAVITRKVFSTFVEMVQNIVNYADSPTGDANETLERYGAVAVGRNGDKYTIVCGNEVHNQHVERMKKRLEPIQSMTLDEIKQEYKRRLRAENEATSKGAGLGFLTVARDASEPIEFSFAPHRETPETLSYFYLKAII